MSWKSRILFLAMVGALSQALLLGGFGFLQWQRHDHEAAIETLKLDLRRARELQVFLDEIHENTSGAVASFRRSSIESWQIKARSWKPSVETLGAYAGYQLFRDAFDNYQEDLEAVGDILGQGRAASRNASMVEALMLLKTSEELLRRNFKPLIENISNQLEILEIDAHQKDIVIVTVLVLIGTVSFFGLLVTGLMWFRDWQANMKKLDAALRQLSRGENLRETFFQDRHEFGRLGALVVQASGRLADLRQAMIRWDRLKAMGQLAGGIAHELNNPLVGVLGQAEILRERLPEGDSARSQVTKIIAAAERCRRIVRNLLDFSRQRDSEFAQVTIEKVLQSVKDLVATEIEKSGIEWLEEIEPGLPSFWASPVDLTEAILNLVMNARDAMPRGGRLSIRVREADEAPERYPMALVIEVQDSGLGIAPEALPRLFEAFYTTKELGKGTGLGLSTVYGIVKNHGGQVKAYSDGLGKGAKFSIYLPIKTVQAKVSAPAWKEK